MREKIVAGLEKKYQESVTAAGITSKNKMVEVLTSETGSWTILVTNTHKMSCLVASGENWQAFAPVFKRPGA